MFILKTVSIVPVPLMHNIHVASRGISLPYWHDLHHEKYYW